MERVKTGIPGLDNLLSGGIPKGRTILVSGSCGAGKTILASQFIYNGVKQYNQNGVLISLEQDKNNIIDDLLSVGMNVKNLKGFSMLGGSFETINYYKIKLKADIDDVLAEIREVIEEVKAKRVALDSLNLFFMLFDDEFERWKILLKLRNLFTELKCTSILTYEMNDYSQNNIPFEFCLVDGVITLFNKRIDNVLCRAVNVLKLRGSEHVKKVCPFEINNKGLVVFPNQKLHKIL